jgi:hypothetical protein
MTRLSLLSEDRYGGRLMRDYRCTIHPNDEFLVPSNIFAHVRVYWRHLHQFRAPTNNLFLHLTTFKLHSI